MSRSKSILLSLAVVVVGIVALAACGSNGSATTAPGSNDGTGALPAGSFSQQQVESLARALASGGQAAGIPQAFNGQQAGLWVNGRGEVSATPDLALLNLGVEARSETVSDARSQGAEALNAMVGVLKEGGLADTDIQTRNFNIRPQYATREEMECQAVTVKPPSIAVPPGPDDETSESQPLQERAESCFPVREQVIVGYNFTTQLTAKIRDLDRVGEIIDGTVEAGGDLVRIQGITFTVKDRTSLEDQARELAVTALVAKAEQMASAAGIELGNLRFLTEIGSSFPVAARGFDESVAFAQSASATPILGRELEFSVSVQGVFEIAE